MGVRRPKYLTGLQVNKRRCIASSGFSLREPAKRPVIDCESWHGRFEINPRTTEKRGLLVNPYEVAGKWPKFVDTGAGAWYHGCGG